MRKVAHTWRFSGDVGPNWGTLLSVLDHYAREQVTLANVAGFSAGRGGWNDPDVVGYENRLMVISLCNSVIGCSC